MPLVTPPTDIVLMSVYSHSGPLSAMIDTTSRGRRPRATSPRPTRRARSPYSRQVIARQIPRCFSRMATCSPRTPTTWRKSRGSVAWPWTVHTRTSSLVLTAMSSHSSTVAPRELAGALTRAILQDREVTVDQVKVLGDTTGVPARVGAHHEIFADGEQREHLTALGDVTDAEPRHLVGIAALDLAPRERHRA